MLKYIGSEIYLQIIGYYRLFQQYIYHKNIFFLTEGLLASV